MTALGVWQAGGARIASLPLKGSNQLIMALQQAMELEGSRGQAASSLADALLEGFLQAADSSGSDPVVLSYLMVRLWPCPEILLCPVALPDTCLLGRGCRAGRVLLFATPCVCGSAVLHPQHAIDQDVPVPHTQPALQPWPLSVVATWEV